MIRRVLIFLNKWSPSVSILKKELSRVLVWVKFHDVLLGRSSYARILIEIDASNGFSDNLVMVVPNLEGPGYTKETIRGGSSGADDEGFIKVKKKKSGGKGGTKNFKPVSVKLKTQYHPKLNQTTKEVSPKTTSSVGKKNVSTLEEDNSSTCLVEKIYRFEKQLLEGTCVLVDEDGKPIEKGDYLDDHGREDEVELGDNEMASFMAFKQSVVGYGTKSLQEQ
ncbi:hypothetical protein Tco_0783975 [Tanacetum coccineum]